MESNIINNETKYKLILIEQFPNVIVEMILSYLNKHNLQYVEYITTRKLDRVLVQGNNDFVHRYYSNELHCKNEIYKIPDEYRVIDFFNDAEHILVNNNGIYKILNIQNTQIVNNLEFIKIMGEICTFNNKYIIFKEYNEKNIHFFDIINDKLVCSITCSCVTTTESAIIDDTIFLTGHYEPIIFKYDISGKHIENINFKKKILGTPWNNIFVKIIEHEIILTIKNNILFYDLAGLLLSTLTIDNNMNLRPIITLNHIYIIQDKKICKHKRVL
jgi:hypothetical protein